MSSIWSTGFLTFYLIFCIISLIGSLYVAHSITKFGSSTLSARLVLYLHISQIIQDVMAIPYIWSANDTICKIAGFAHIYSGIANIMCVTIMIIAYRYIFFEDTYKICDFCLRYLSVLVFIFPLLCVLCFISDSYGQVENNLCSYHNKGHLGTLWYVLFGIFSIIVFLFCTFVVVKTVLDVYKLNEDLGKKLFKTLVFYAFATLVFWIPRTVFQAIDESNEDQVIGNCMIFAAGILYSLIFLQEKKSLKTFEQQNQTNMDVESIADGGNMDFNLSVDEDLDRMSRSSNAGPSVTLRGFNGNTNSNSIGNINNGSSSNDTQNPMTSGTINV